MARRRSARASATANSAAWRPTGAASARARPRLKSRSSEAGETLWGARLKGWPSACGAAPCAKGWRRAPSSHAAACRRRHACPAMYTRRASCEREHPSRSLPSAGTPVPSGAQLLTHVAASAWPARGQQASCTSFPVDNRGAMPRHGGAPGSAAGGAAAQASSRWNSGRKRASLSFITSASSAPTAAASTAATPPAAPPGSGAPGAAAGAGAAASAAGGRWRTSSARSRKPSAASACAAAAAASRPASAAAAVASSAHADGPPACFAERCAVGKERALPACP